MSRRLVPWSSAPAGAGARRRRPRSLLGRLPLGLVIIALAVWVALRSRARREEDRWLEAGHTLGGPLGGLHPVGAASARGVASTQPVSAPAPAPAPEAAPAPAPEAGDGLAELLVLSRQELYARAQALDVPGRSRMSKRELAEAIAAAQRH